MSGCCAPGHGSVGDGPGFGYLEPGRAAVPRTHGPKPTTDAERRAVLAEVATELSADRERSQRRLEHGGSLSMRELHKGMCRIEGGRFHMGSEDDDAVPGDGEGPVREVAVSAFWIDETTVTNRAFARFIRDTGYQTDAEKFGWSFVFGGYLPAESAPHVIDARVPGAPWWRAVRGSYWRAPYGPDSPDVYAGKLEQHPVVHVSHNDAVAYAEWAGKRLPTEAEWEYAARGGLDRKRFAWGDELTPGGRHRANIWQGDFPTRNTADDGYLATAPVKSFPANGYGLYEVAGNVWEWCEDWWSTDWHVRDDYDPTNPFGPDEGDSKVMKGGSHLCHASYCNRYRVAARTSNTADSSSSNTGFRCVADE